LEGWIEQGVLRATGRAAGPGSRRAFALPDIVKAAILCELQRLFGAHLRPGSLQGLIADWDERDPEWLFLDASTAPDADPQVLSFSARGNAIAFEPQPLSCMQQQAKRADVLVTVNVGRIAKRIRTALST
jgi:hypothetical protein